MKKITVGALAALLALALSALAYAQYAPPSHTQTASVSPTKAGTKKKPKSVRVKIGLRTGATDNGTVSNFTFRFGKNLTISPKGFPACTVNTIVKAGNTTSKCTAKSKLGSGTASAFLGKRGGTKIEFAVSVFAGGPKSLTIYIVGTKAPFTAIKRAFPAQVQSDSGEFKQKISTNIPQDIQFSAGTPVVLESVNLNLKASNKVKRRTYNIFSSTGCSASKQYIIGTRLTYSVPAGAVSTAKGTAKCS